MHAVVADTFLITCCSLVAVHRVIFEFLSLYANCCALLVSYHLNLLKGEEMPIVRRSGNNGKDLSSFLQELPYDGPKHEQKRCSIVRISASAFILAVLIFAYHALVEYFALTEKIEDLSSELHECNDELERSIDITKSLEESFEELSSSRQKQTKAPFLSFDAKITTTTSSDDELYRLVDVLMMPGNPRDDQVMTAFQEKWSVSDSLIYQECGRVVSRPNTVFKQASSKCRIAIISTWKPRPCGIATYSGKLYDGFFSKCPSGSVIDVIGVRNPNDPIDLYKMEPQVKFSFSRDTLSEYNDAATFINENEYNMVVLSYEFGIFGDEYIMCLLSNIRRAHVITVLHTVADNLPFQKQALTEQVMLLSHKIVVMTETMRNELDLLHGIPPHLANVIPHGVPRHGMHREWEIAGFKRSPSEIIAYWGFNSDKVIFSNGLLHQGKGLEYVINAMPSVLQVFPSAKYVIQGSPHPTGEGTSEYYRSLKDLVKKLSLENSVFFLPEFLPDNELLRRIEHSSVYINAYLDRVASVSGTLVMAMSTGVPCISTPYPFAREMLSGQSGILVPFADSESISRSVTYVLASPLKAHEMGNRAMKKTHSWGEVAAMFLKLFENSLETK